MRGPLCAVALAGLAVLGGCSRAHPHLSWVSPKVAPDARQLAGAIAQWVSEEAPPASSTVLLAPVSHRQADNGVTLALIDDLRRMGFGLATSLDASPDAHLVRYVVTPAMGSYVLVRVDVDGVEATRLFYRDAQAGLVPAASLSVREL